MDLDLTQVDTIIATIGTTPDKVLPILQALQQAYGYLPEPALERVCECSEITPAAITGFSSFYDQFRFTPPGEHIVRVCVGTACHVKGGEQVYEDFRRFLKISEGDDTDADRLFTVEKVACIGCCMLAPAIQIDDVVYGHLTAERVPGVLQDFLCQQDRVPQAQRGDGTVKDVSQGQVRVCLCSSCRASGSQKVYEQLAGTVRAHQIPVQVQSVGCHGASYLAPLVEVETGGYTFRYGRVQPTDLTALIGHHFRARHLSTRVQGAVSRLLDRWLTGEAVDPVIRYGLSVRTPQWRDFLEPQVHIATDHWGQLDPTDLAAYRARGGFTALQRCLQEMSPHDVVAEIEAGALRGRGGAGYPSFKKWAAVAAAQGNTKYVVCNGDEGDPGAFMDRMLLESYPYRVIEGLIIAARAVGAQRGYVYVRAEYPLAIERLRRALEICQAQSLLGDGILGSDFSFSLEIVAGAGAFVCGEETALIASIEGRRGMPRLRPPYPAETGLWECPTLINNVETLSLVPWILQHGAESFAALGTATSKGTKVFALAGKVKRGGLIEVPMGVTLRQVVEEIGGGIENGRKLKAVQIGGPSGGCIPAHLDYVPIDYEGLTDHGAMMGSGGLVVLDETDCMVDMARYFLEFTQDQSCGKCTFCRVGTLRMLEILERLCKGQGKAADLATLETLSHQIIQGSLCALGGTAPNPVLSTLTYFRDEYEAHVAGRCPAGKCKELIRYQVTDDCIGCTLCAQRCPTDAIKLTPYEKHEINDEKCVRCGTCKAVCPENSIEII